MAKTQVKSRKRVVEHGEVFTNEREVKAMCDLVKQETERIDSRFLEPACGDGNFLAEILARKLEVVRKNSRADSPEYERNAIIALSSLYGVELLEDNVLACRERLFEIWDKAYSKNCIKTATDEIRDCAKFILKRNILCGNALTLKCVDSNAKDTEEPIIFSEWSLVTGDLIKRRDFRLDVLMMENEAANSYTQFSLFGDDTLDLDRWEIDEVTHKRIPKPIREYPPTDYRRLTQHE